MKKGIPLPLRMHFRTDLKPRVNFPLLATSWSLLLILSVVFFYTAVSIACPSRTLPTTRRSFKTLTADLAAVDMLIVLIKNLFSERILRESNEWSTPGGVFQPFY